MKQKNKFTVLMSVYKNDCSEKFLSVFDSIKRNTLQPDQIIIVIDGPLNHPLENSILNVSENSNVLIKRLSKNGGLQAALNEGLKLVSTDWVVRCDADDINHENRFQRLMVECNEYDLIGSAVDEFDSLGNKIASKKMPEQHNEILKFITYRNPFNHMSVAFRLKPVIECGGYPNIFLKEDYALWALLISRGARVKNIPDTLVDVSAGIGMYSRRGGLRSAISEIQLQQYLTELGFKNRIDAIIHGVMRISIFLSPVFVRKLIYENLLRRVK